MSDKKDIKDYLHLYMGCDALFYNNGFSYEPTKDILQNIYLDEPPIIHSVAIGHRTVTANYFRYIKLALRPLSDMTEKEARKLYSFRKTPSYRFDGFEANNHSVLIFYKNGNGNRGSESFNKFYPEQMKYLLDIPQYFDLFGLIDAGLAIDKTKIL